MRTGGKQEVRIVHVHQAVQVNDGGQATWKRAGGGAGIKEGGTVKVTHEPLMSGWREYLTLANAAPRCGARRKSDGQPCEQAAMPNGRCRHHGGMSTGPRTP